MAGKTVLNFTGNRKCVLWEALFEDPWEIDRKTQFRTKMFIILPHGLALGFHVTPLISQGNSYKLFNFYDCTREYERVVNGLCHFISRI